MDPLHQPNRLHYCGADRQKKGYGNSSLALLGDESAIDHEFGA